MTVTPARDDVPGMDAQTEKLANYDPNAPLAALQKAGVTIERSETSSSTSINVGGVGVPAGGTAGERFEMQLPAASPLAVVFSKEGIVKKLSKIFKKELQVGDPQFDARVFIATSDEDTTRRFLENGDARRLVMEFVSDGGTVAIEGAKLTIHAVNEGAVATVSERDVARFACRVMAFA
jgi:hypothetical protein